MSAIATFIVLHWTLAVFCQTFFLHRYGAHRQFTMSKGWERFFYLCTFVTQGASFLSPRAYAIMHREHHAYSDTGKDPHSPYVYKTPYHLLKAMWSRYAALRYRKVEPEARFLGGVPSGRRSTDGRTAGRYRSPGAPSTRSSTSTSRRIGRSCSCFRFTTSWARSKV